MISAYAFIKPIRRKFF